MIVIAQTAASIVQSDVFVRRFSTVTAVPVGASVTTISFRIPVACSTGCVRCTVLPSTRASIGELSGQ